MSEEERSGHGRFQVSDRRFWVKDESAVESARIPETRYPSFIEELKGRTELAEKRLEERLEELDKEHEAFRSRMAREVERRVEREKVAFIKPFLEVLDNFERALESVQRQQPSDSLEAGVRLNLQLLRSKLQAAGIRPLELQGKPFDPHLAEASGMIAVDDPSLDQTVVEVLQEGYCLGEQLLRPARVRVGNYVSE